MYTPPQDDETMDQTPERRTGPGYRPARSYNSSRSYYYSDEHPEVPKVKRASLGLDETDARGVRAPKDAAAAGQTSTEKVVRTERTQPRPPSVRGIRPAPSSRTRNNRSERPSPRPSSYHHKAPRARIYDEDLLDTLEEHTGHTEAAPRTATKIMVAHRRRSTISTVYEPPSGPSAYRSQGKHPKQRNTFWTFLQRASHNRRLMLVISIFIILLLVSPMVVNAIVNNNHATLIFGNNSAFSPANSGGVQSVTGGSTSDPHTLAITPANTTHPAPPVFATSAYLLDADTGATLYAHNPFMHLPMLSTTKLMTALLAAEKGNPEQKITINNAISNDINQLAADSSVMGIKKGETYTLRELLYGMFLMSGNDAATAVADAIGGNLPTFVSMMNQRAAQLGLHDTHYMNPHGLLEDGHYSSAHDLAILGKTVMNIPLLHQISGTRQYTLAKTAQHAEHVMFNGNQFLWWYPGVDGGKPGWDGGSNFIQVVSVTRNHHHLIGVTMHTTDWWTDMRDLMNWGFNSFQWVSPHDSDLVSPIPYDSDWNYFARDTKTVTVPTADSGRYYVYTGYSISGIILTYFDKNGGLQKFGYPESAPDATETTTVSQRFDRGTMQCDTASRQCKMV
ncbi:MAG TPA: D-alanyl-D-alanine carboxypeptidase family protein [Ktedonobacteraceae bacterium]